MWVILLAPEDHTLGVVGPANPHIPAMRKQGRHLHTGLTLSPNSESTWSSTDIGTVGFCFCFCLYIYNKKEYGQIVPPTFNNESEKINMKGFRLILRSLIILFSPLGIHSFQNESLYLPSVTAAPPWHGKSLFWAWGMNL